MRHKLIPKKSRGLLWWFVCGVGSLLLLPIPIIGFIIFLVFILGSIQPLMTELVLGLDNKAGVFYQSWNNYLAAIGDAYCSTVRNALAAEHPLSIIYLLESALKELERFNLSNQQPHRTQYQTLPGNWYGFPNQANLREAICMAQDLAKKWSRLDATERARSMTEVREKIESEEFFLDWVFMGQGKMNIPKGENIYWYSFTEEDYQELLSLYNQPSQVPINESQSSRPEPNRQQTCNISQILTYEDWLTKYWEDLQYLSEEKRAQSYQRYSNSK